MKFNLSPPHAPGPAALAAVALPLLTGCSSFTSSTPSTLAAQALNLSGSVHGGQQPITGARVYLYTVGTYTNSPSTSMLTGTGVSTDSAGNGYVTSDSSGSFSITGDYTCPSGNTGISTYLLAVGGNPGLADGTSNSAIALMAPLGACSSLSASTFIVVNEVTTVAAVTALQQFMTDETHIADRHRLRPAHLWQSSWHPKRDAHRDQPGQRVHRSRVDHTPPALLVLLPFRRSILSAIFWRACINTASPTSTQCAALFAATTPHRRALLPLTP